MDVSGFLSWLRDAFTVAFFVSVGIALLVHSIKRELGWLWESRSQFANSERPVKQVKFNGSAATWVK